MNPVRRAKYCRLPSIYVMAAEHTLAPVGGWSASKRRRNGAFGGGKVGIAFGRLVEEQEEAKLTYKTCGIRRKTPLSPRFAPGVTK